MARRKSNTTVVLPTTFVGTVYDHNTGVYVASRKDGSITFGKFGQRGTNVSTVKGPQSYSIEREV